MKNKNLIVIIARESGRYDVSKQNLRLVNGKPLLSYVIKTAKESKNCYTIVSTDSDEVKQYAEFYQVPVLDRSKKLTKDDTKLIEIARNKQTTGLGHVTLNDMKNLLVVLPNEKFMEYAYKNLNPIFNTIYNNLLEFQSLTKTRDTLLPKLMSGEIRV